VINSFELYYRLVGPTQTKKALASEAFCDWREKAFEAFSRFASRVKVVTPLIRRTKRKAESIELPPYRIILISAAFIRWRPGKEYGLSFLIALFIQL